MPPSAQRGSARDLRLIKLTLQRLAIKNDCFAARVPVEIVKCVQSSPASLTRAACARRGSNERAIASFMASLSSPLVVLRSPHVHLSVPSHVVLHELFNAAMSRNLAEATCAISADSNARTHVRACCR